MNILQEIAREKRREVEERKKNVPLSELAQRPFFQRKVLSLSENLLESQTGIIAEFKRRSPSVPEINLEADAVKVAAGYRKAGASAISILTDEIYFGGSADDFRIIREQTDLPLLRKDFIIDSYQITESKSMGADAILLIAALLSKKEISEFSRQAAELGLEVLFEVHNEEELKKAAPGMAMIGINNRDLKTFRVDLETSRTLAKKVPPGVVLVSESGISSQQAVRQLKKYGFSGFLIGEYFMKSGDPGKSANKFISGLL